METCQLMATSLRRASSCYILPPSLGLLIYSVLYLINYYRVTKGITQGDIEAANI
jgi:hypothetical protein